TDREPEVLRPRLGQGREMAHREGLTGEVDLLITPLPAVVQPMKLLSRLVSEDFGTELVNRTVPIHIVELVRAVTIGGVNANEEVLQPRDEAITDSRSTRVQCDEIVNIAKDFSTDGEW